MEGHCCESILVGVYTYFFCLLLLGYWFLRIENVMKTVNRQNESTQYKTVVLQHKDVCIKSGHRSVVLCNFKYVTHIHMH